MTDSSSDNVNKDDETLKTHCDEETEEMDIETGMPQCSSDNFNKDDGTLKTQ
ncbi:Hypothetical protein CINCED_3A013929 [Cinara cedri]|uniref:Uncharacterized protein n=1 Tax=Cinara cedri TaxID=506608 RepID=A0A5E4MUL6_9HEMI|nr:Hypothetical protein CINCED_3A013929 [Cinara cedri]